MTTKQWNEILNPTLYVCGAGLVFTGILQQWVLPKGSAGRGLTWLGLGRHEWGQWHFALGTVVTVAVTLHLFLHWAWIRAYLWGAPGDARPRWVLPALGLTLLLAALALPFLIAPTFDPAATGGGGGQG